LGRLMKFKNGLIISIGIALIYHSNSNCQQLLTPTSSFLGTQYYERVGYHLHTAGDVNGDGYDDFLIGTFHNKTNEYNSGAAYLILGNSTANWGNDISLSNADARFIGQQAYDAVGYCLGGAGDVNGDGFSDMIIGAPAGDDLVPENPGHVYLVFGKPTPDWGFYSELPSNADASFDGENQQDLAGLSAAFTGDINGDGYDEIICGAPFNDYGANDAGKAYLILGKATGWQRGFNLNEADASFYGSNGSGLVGYGVDGVGDVNGDGITDFAISALGEGKVYLFFGRKSVNWGKNYDINRADVIFVSEQNGNYTGWRVSGTGDVNGDGYDDFLIGAPYHDQNENEDSKVYLVGKVYLILGRSSGWKTNLSEADASYYGEAYNDEAGYDTQAAGDVNGDGYADFLIGAWYNDANGVDAGKMYLIKGKASGWQRNIPLSSIEDYFVGEYAGDYAGYSVSTAGDVNGDGLNDIITSASYYSEAYYWGGKIYIFISQNNIPPAITDSRASITGENILLEWSPSSVTTIYNVYRDTNYDFKPDSANRIGFHVSDEDPNKTGVQWTDTDNGANIVGDITKNYFYKVTAVASIESAPSNVAGEFDYNLITTSGTDINELVVIFDTKNTSTQITTAEELAQAIPKCSDVFYWDAAGQGTVGHVKGLPFNNFAIYPGYPYIVNVTEPTVWSTAGAYITPSSNLITTNGTDINHIGAPLEKTSLTTAEMLGQDIPGCTDVFYWDTDGQGTVGHVVGLPFNNFSVHAGYPYYVNVTAPIVWPSSVGTMLKTDGSSPKKNIGPGCNVPHTVYGNLSHEAGIDVKANKLQIRAWIMGRPKEVLTMEAINSGCNGQYWWISVGNFATEWQVGDSLRVEITDESGKFRGSKIVKLTDAGSDYGGEIRLAYTINSNEVSLSAIPKDFQLNQNYPNPFNPETMICFQLPETRNVIFMVYNLLGDKICTLINEKKDAGYHQVTWDGKDNLGQEMPSGIYLIKIEASDFRAYKKMIKIR
jgi:hypothetical protein